MKKRHRASPPRKSEKPQEQTSVETSGKATASPPRVDRQHPWMWKLFSCGILLIVVYLVYSNSFLSGWVLDNQFIVKLDPRNKQASLENLELIWKKDYWWPTSVTGAYRPIVSTSYMLNWAAIGDGNHASESEQVAGFHWLNILAHGINAVLAYFLMLKLLRGHWAALFTAALFAVHPIATESVTNIVGRADEFMAMGFLGASLLYIRSTEARGIRRLPWLLGMMMVFAAGFFSKESELAFMAVPALYDGVYRWGSEEYRGRRVRNILLDCPGYLIMTLPLTVMLLVRSFIYHQTPRPALLFLDNPIVRFDWNDASTLAVNIGNWIFARLTACKVAGIAVWKLIWPAQLSSDYSYNQIELFGGQFWSVDGLKTILSVMLVAGSLAVAVACYKRYKAVCFFIFFFWIAYGPTSNFVVTSSNILAERFLYLPLLAFCALLVLAAELVVQPLGLSLELDITAFKSIKRNWKRLVPHAAFLLILALYSVRTYNRNFDWQSDVTLGESTISAAPKSFRSYGKLAEAYYQTDPIYKIDRIIELAEAGVRIIDPLPNSENRSKSYLTLGIYYGLKGERVATRDASGFLIMNESTREWFEKSARILERGIEIDLAGNEANHARESRRGNAKSPDTGAPDLYMYLGKAYQRLDRNDKALEAYKYQRHLNPSDPMVYFSIASAQDALGQAEDAAVSLLQCVILDPQRRDAWQSLMAIDSQINHEPIPALQETDGRLQIREDNMLVRKQLLYAYAGLMNTAQSSNSSDMWRNAHDVAVNHYKFDSMQLDAVLLEIGASPSPPVPIFHTFGKKLSEEGTTPSSR
jgi:tetratricopeptide (TPR) repeat protein